MSLIAEDAWQTRARHAKDYDKLFTSKLRIVCSHYLILNYSLNALPNAGSDGE